MKITAVHVDTLELTMEEPFVIASSTMAYSPCDMFVVKLMKTGGILNALKVNAIAEAAGITVMVGSMGESSVAMSAHFHVHIALANAVHGDADLPWRPGALEHDLGRGIKQEVAGGVSWIDVPAGPGLGIEPIEENVELQRVERRW